MLAEVEARLEVNAPTLKSVQGAAEFAAVKANPPKNRQPAAYVVPNSDSAGPNRVAVNAVRQRNQINFAVVLAIGNLRDRRGGTATRSLEALRDEVIAALLGWPPTADHEQVEYDGGLVIDFRDGVVWWQLDFRTATHLGS